MQHFIILNKMNQLLKESQEKLKAQTQYIEIAQARLGVLDLVSGLFNHGKLQDPSAWYLKDKSLADKIADVQEQYEKFLRNSVEASIGSAIKGAQTGLWYGTDSSAQRDSNSLKQAAPREEAGIFDRTCNVDLPERPVPSPSRPSKRKRANASRRRRVQA